MPFFHGIMKWISHGSNLFLSYGITISEISTIDNKEAIEVIATTILMKLASALNCFAIKYITNAVGAEVAMTQVIMPLSRKDARSI